MTEDEEFQALEQRLNMKEQEYEQINHPNGVTTWKTKPKEQPKALRLADELEAQAGTYDCAAADELRRLHALNQELLEMLAWIDRRCPAAILLQDPHKVYTEAAFDAGVCARAAIAKAQGASNE